MQSLTTFKCKKFSLLRLFCLSGIFFLVSLSNSWATAYYISPAGFDSANGLTVTTPIATFLHAYSIMSGGDTLNLMDGIYIQQLHVPASESGTSGNPTVFQAVNRGKAILKPTDLGPDEAPGAIYVYSSAARGRVGYITFDGLIAYAIGEKHAISVRSADNIATELMTHHITIKNCGAIGSALERNVNTIEIMGSLDTLVEDCFAFGYGRKAMEVYGAIRATLRRIVLRFEWWQGDLYKPNDPRDGLSMYNSQDSIVENVIVMDSGPRPAGSSADMHGITAGGNDADGTTIQGSSNIAFRGCFSLRNRPLHGQINGFKTNGGSGGPVRNISFKDCISWDNSGYGLYVENNADGIDIDYMTTNHNTLSGINISQYPQSPILNVTIENNLSADNQNRGIYYGTETTSFINNTTVRNPNGTTREGTYEPEITYLATHTPVAGYDRGADITKRYIDGNKTSQDLWPWPNEQLIRNMMCDPIHLKMVEDRINDYDGSSITYNPAWCASGKTLTTYIWEYLGKQIPDSIYGGNPTPRIPAIFLLLLN